MSRANNKINCYVNLRCKERVECIRHSIRFPYNHIISDFEVFVKSWMNFNNIDIFLYVIYYDLWVSLLPYFQSTNCKFAKLWKGVIKGGNQHNWKSANNHFTDSISTQTTLTGLLKCGLQSTRPYIFIISDFMGFVKSKPSRGMKNALAFWKSNKHNRKRRFSICLWAVPFNARRRKAEQGKVT